SWTSSRFGGASKAQKSTARPFFSQSPYRTGSGPSRPPSSRGISAGSAALRRASASASARCAAGGRSVRLVSVMSSVIGMTRFQTRQGDGEGGIGHAGGGGGGDDRRDRGGAASVRRSGEGDVRPRAVRYRACR